MKKIDKFEEHLRAKAEKQQATPPPFIWDNIDKALPKRKKRNRLFFWFFAGLTICGIAFFAQHNFITNNKYNTSESTSTESSENYSADVIHNDEILNADSHVSKKVIRQKRESASNASDLIYQEDRNPNEIGDDKMLAETRRSKKNPSQSKPSTSSINSQPNSTGAEKLNHNRIITNENQSAQLVREEDAVSGHSKISSQSKVDHYLDASDKVILNEKGIQTDQEISQLALVDLSELPIRNRALPELDLMQVNDSSFGTHDDDYSTNSSFFFEVGALIGSHNTHLQARDSLSSFRLDTESNWYTWGAKVRLGYHLTNNFYIKTGVDFIESRDKFNFQESSVQLTLLEETVTAKRFFSVGDLTYRQINGSLALGAEKKKGKFIYGVEASALFNLRFIAEGKSLVGPSEISRVENLEIYKDRLGLGYSGALIFGSRVGEHNTIYLKPTYSRYVSMTSLETSEVSNNLSQYYLELSFKRNLN